MARMALLVTLTLALSLLGAIAGPQASPAHACSGPEAFDPLAESDSIVGGWVVGWEERPDIPAGGSFRTLQFSLSIDVVYEGPRATRVEAFDSMSYTAPNLPWQGGSSCGAFGADPVGKYVILGLKRDEAGLLRTFGPRTVFIGDSPSGTEHVAATGWLMERVGILPPKTGSGGLVSQR